MKQQQAAKNGINRKTVNNENAKINNFFALLLRSDSRNRKKKFFCTAEQGKNCFFGPVGVGGEVGTCGNASICSGKRREIELVRVFEVLAPNLCLKFEFATLFEIWAPNFCLKTTKNRFCGSLWGLDAEYKLSKRRENDFEAVFGGWTFDLPFVIDFLANFWGSNVEIFPGKGCKNQFSALIAALVSNFHR